MIVNTKEASERLEYAMKKIFNRCELLENCSEFHEEYINLISIKDDLEIVSQYIDDMMRFSKVLGITR